MKVILLLVLAVPVTPWIYAPNVRLALYGEDVYNLICKTGLNSTIKSLERHGRRLYECTNSTYYPVLCNCWQEITGIQYPSSREEWRKFYCNNTSSWIRKNLAEHCFISKWKKKIDFDNFKDTVGYCINFELDDEDWEGVGSEMPSVPPDQDYYSDKRCNNVSNEDKKIECAHENFVRKICVQNNTKVIQEAIHQHKCIERAAPTKLKIVQFCWNIVIKKPYPKNDKEWKDLTCNIVFPSAKKKLIYDCIRYRVTRDDQSVSAIIEADCDDSYFPLQEKRYYRQRLFSYEISDFEELIEMEEGYKPVCQEKDISRTEHFLKRNELKCLKDSVQTPLGLKVLAYCWDRLFGKKNISFPSEERDWLSFACSDNQVKILRTGQEVVNCFENLINPGLHNDYDDDSPVTSVEAETLTSCKRDVADVDYK